jgi:hypothetical protein
MGRECELKPTHTHTHSVAISLTQFSFVFVGNNDGVSAKWEAEIGGIDKRHKNGQ